MSRYDVYESAQDMMICELDKLTQKTEVTPTTLEYMDKIVDIIKDLDEILDREDMIMDGNSQRSYGRDYNRMDSYRNNNSYAGRAMRNSYSGSGSNSLDGNSQGNSKKEMLEHLRMAMDSSSSEEERKRIQRMISEIEGK